MLSRACGKCGVTLTKNNTGYLSCLQPDCNKCTKNNNCIHKWRIYPFEEGSKICMKCGAIE